MRLVLWFGLALALSACLETSSTDLSEAPSAVSVTRSNIVIAGPPGFCVDPRASRNTNAGAFVLLASCAAISNAPLAPQPDLPVVLTATVSVSVRARFSPEAWDAYFRSDAGRARLSTRGRADEVEILATRAESGAFYLFAHDRGGNRNQWRGIVTLGDVVVTISMRPTGNTPMSRQSQFALLDAFGDRLLAVNRNLRISSKSAGS